MYSSILFNQNNASRHEDKMCFEQSLELVIVHGTPIHSLGYSLLPQYRINFFAEECLGYHQNTSLDIRREKGKNERLRSERKGLQTLFQLGVCANVYDNSSSASAVSVVESTPEVGRTSVDDNQPSAS